MEIPTTLNGKANGHGEQADAGAKGPALADVANVYAPRFPLTIDELDVSPEFLCDLALKTVSIEADCTTASTAQRLHLGTVITDTLLERLYNDKLIEKKGTVSLRNNRYGMTERGWIRTEQLMTLCSYVGAAPVSLELYTEMITSQVSSRAPVTREAIERTVADLVLSDEVKRRLGVVASSGRSLFLSGPPGNGKTAMARALVEAIPGGVWIPYAIEVDGQVIRVFDKHTHQVADHPEANYDRRGLIVQPPLVVVGGELTIQSLDLVAAETPRFYEAPFQLKANGGVLVVDDLGRQRVSARELLNRWIIPLEYRFDYLTLTTGKKIQVPFEQIVIFATNLSHTDLVDAAFMRRMGYRLYVEPPSLDTYAEIFRRFAAGQKLDVDSSLLK
ncbi:AAA family ATPase, partial [bacterium]|nr:AAA family ATPase [bacterium]